MKHRWRRTLLLFLVLLGAGSLLVLAAYVPTGRELVSLGYLEKTFQDKALDQSQVLIDEREDLLSPALQGQLDAVNAAYTFRAEALNGSLERAEQLTDLRFKQGDVITFGSGSSFLLLAGEASAQAPLGEVVDTTTGTVIQNGDPVQPQHYCLAAEQTVAQVVITSPTAVLMLEGSYSLTPGSGTDYNMLADALKAMGLFKGTDTGYGSGYDLEKVPTRIEGLIMFLRLLGEESAALSCTAVCPFTDVAPWAQSYVAYAYEQGYTKGTGGTLFAPNQTISAGEYLTFLLRTLGYRDSGDSPDFAWDTALIKALEFGVLTAREHKMLTEQPFLRAQVVYLSYYALDARTLESGQDLFTVLTSSGALDRSAVDTARSAVSVRRIR